MILNNEFKVCNLIIFATRNLKTEEELRNEHEEDKFLR